MDKIRLQTHWIRGIWLFVLILSPISSIAGVLELIPRIGIATEYDDNIRFVSNSNEEDDDLNVSTRPSLQLNYTTELFTFNALTEIDDKRYFNQTDYDRTNQLHQIGTEYRAHRRWTFFANGEYRKDETTETRFEETGRVFRRNREERYEGNGGVWYNLTELSDIGANFTYLKVDFSSNEDDDYDRYTINLPFRKRFQNQRDTILLQPAYSKYDADDGDEGEDYRFTLTWEHLLSETLTSIIEAGGRYTEIENDDGSNDSNWGGVGSIALIKTSETFTGSAKYSRDLRSTTEGEIIEVDRFYLNGDKRLTERFGLRFNGNLYHSTKESDENNSDRVISFELIPATYYMLTENHLVELSYRYRRQMDRGDPGNPVRNQNRVTLRLILQFPKRWD